MSIGQNFFYESNTLTVGAWTLGSVGLQDGGGVVIGTTGANRFGIAIDDDDDAVNFWRRDRDDGRVEFSVGTTSQFIKYDSAASTAVEINTKSFFLGNATTSFVSGSNNLLEISSSNFHLDRTGNVDMTGTVTATAGAIGGFTIANSNITGSGGTFVTSGKTSDSGQDTTTRAELLPANFLVRADAGAVGSANGHDESHIVFDAVTAEAFNFFNGETNDKFRTVSTRMENAHFGKYDVNDSFTTGNLVIGKGGRPQASIRTTTDDSSPDSIILPETTNGGWIIGDALEVKPVSAGLGTLTRNYTNAVFSVVGQSYLGNTELQGDVVLGYDSGDTIIFSGSVDSDISMGATRKLYLDGGSNTYITEAAADRVEIVVGGTPIMSIKESTTSSRTLIYRDLYIDGATNSAGSGDGLDADYLRMHNNGSNSYIDFGSGNLYIRDDGTTAITVADSTRAVTIATDLTVSDDLFVNDFARIDALRVGTTSTDPGDGNLYVEGDITVGSEGITPTSTNVFQCNTTAFNINSVSEGSLGSVTLGTPSVENSTYVAHTNNQSSVDLKLVGEYAISVDLIVDNSATDDRHTFFGYIEHQNSSGTMYYRYPIGGMYIRSDVDGYDAGGIGGQIRLITTAANDRIVVKVLVLDRQNTGTCQLDTSLSRVKIDKIKYG